MFTGIIQAIGRIHEYEARGADARMAIHGGGLDLSDVGLGDSIAVNGVCLTAVALTPDSFSVDVSAETLRVTAGFTPGAEVNLEKALRLADRLGGHHQVALVFAIFLVDQHDHAAGLEFFDNFQGGGEAHQLLFLT